MGGRKAFLSRVIQYGAFQEQLKALAEFAGGNAQGLRHISVWKAKDGTPKTLEDYWVPVYENGRIGTVHGVLRDISDRKRAEDALRESEDKYKTLIDNIPFAVFELDGTGTLITANKTFADFIGPPRDELAGRNMADLFPPEAIDVRKKYVEKAITEKTIQRFTDELNCRIFQHIIVPLSARGGGRVQIIARDVTDEVAAKQESEEHRLFWEGIFHSSPDAVVALNDENAIAGWNEGAEKLFGYTAEEAEGSNVDDLVSGRNRETQAEAENITSRTMRGERIRPVETVRYRKDGTPVHVRIAGAPIIIDGTVSGVVGVYTDITDRVRAEEGLKNSLEEKEVLMKELNHRVKNNLAMISALIGLKDSALGGGTDVSDLVSQIDAIRLIHEKLDESEHIGAIDVREYLGDLLQTIFSSFSEGPVRVDINIENRQLNTKKAVSLGLIVNELATNAVKHGFTGDTEHRFSIGFTEDTEKGEYIAAVSNSGRPFPPEIDLNNSSTLGLRLISALTEQLNGTLELNRAPEPEFTIRFPAGG